MRFLLDRHGAVPAHEQIKDQIKLAMAVGKLRPGDRLPSIRQLEEELKVGIATIRRAYQELEEADIIDLEHGRGVFVRNGLDKPPAALLEQFNRFYAGISQDLDAANAVPFAFARFFYSRVLEAERHDPSIVFTHESRTLAQDYAEQASRAWQIPVLGLSLQELRQLPSVKRASLRRVIASYFDCDAAREIVRNVRAKVIPVDVQFGEEMLNDLRSLPKSTPILFVLEDHDHAHQSSFVRKFLEEQLSGCSLRISCEPLSKVSLSKEMKAGRQKRIYVSNPVWDHLDEKLRSAPVIRRPKLRVTDEGLKTAWKSIGIV